LLKRFLPKSKTAERPRSPEIYPLSTESYGSRYGGWSIPNGILNSVSICYLAGAGEVISFNVELVDNFGCYVHVIDPSPRAKLHFDKLLECTKKGEKFPVNHSTTEFYSLSKDNVELLHFHELGLWSESKTLKFY